MIAMPLVSLLVAAAAGASPWSLDVSPARTSTPLRSVSPHYVSFALDNAFIRDPSGISGVPLPPDGTNSTRIDFQDPLLNKIMPLVSGGYIRIGGTYTDFVHYYVPGSNHTRCPYATKRYCPKKSVPCCLPLTMERWKEALEFAHRAGMRVVFNLNILHGRFDDYGTHKASCCGYTEEVRPEWDSSEARALMTWTKANISPEMWPAYFGLGNELSGYLSADQWAGDLMAVFGLIQEIFGGTPGVGTTPGTYGPCNCDGASKWETEFMNHMTSRNTHGLGAFSFHGYNHAGSTVAGVANMGAAGIDSSRTFFDQFAKLHAAANTTSQLWITETAWSAAAPGDAPHGGAAAEIDGMCRAADIAWNLDALGAAAEVGVDVFCRETLAGDWLEVIGLWQPGDARTGEDNRPYTPHPDFWVAALWNKLMEVAVLGANYSAPQPQPQPGLNVAAAAAAVPADVEDDDDDDEKADQWLIVHGQSSDYGPHNSVNGSTNAPLYGVGIKTWEECQALCVAATKKDPSAACKSWSWCDSSCRGEWSLRCFGRLDDTWNLHPVPGVTSGCDKTLGKCVAPPPPPPPAPAARVFAHCSKMTKGAVMYAIAATPCARNESLDLTFPQATQLTQWWLSAADPADDMISLNGKNLSVSVAGPLPSLEGESTPPGERVTMPASGVCTVGFVEAVYATPVAACL
jgi:hypothetical protein